MSTRIGAERNRVWKALTDPNQRVLWNPALLGPIEVPEDHPQVGQHARWRYRLRGVPVIMHDRTLEVVEGKRLRSAMALGPLRFDLTCSMESERDRSRTRLSVALAASNVVPVMGGVVDRFAVRRHASEIVANLLSDVRAWCEGAGAPERNRPNASQRSEDAPSEVFSDP